MACRQLGLPTPGKLLPPGSYGRGNLPAWLNGGFIFCGSLNTHLLECMANVAYTYWGWNQEPTIGDPAIQCNAIAKNAPRTLYRRPACCCLVSGVVGLQLQLQLNCNLPNPGIQAQTSAAPLQIAVLLRLANRTADGRSGRLEVFHQGEWGTVSNPASRLRARHPHFLT